MVALKTQLEEEAAGNGNVVEGLGNTPGAAVPGEVEPGMGNAPPGIGGGGVVGAELGDVDDVPGAGRAD